jgi:hypothetical protein
MLSCLVSQPASQPASLVHLPTLGNMESVHAQQGIVVDFKKARAGFLRFALTQHAQNAQNTFVASQQCAHESNSWLSVSIL